MSRTSARADAGPVLPGSCPLASPSRCNSGRSLARLQLACLLLLPPPRAPAGQSPSKMPNILSIDSGRRHLGFVIYQPHTRNVLLWGVAEIPLDKSSYRPALLRFERQCEDIPYSIVVIERQLRHRNVQAGRIEANLKALFYARGKRCTSCHQSASMTFMACNCLPHSGQPLQGGRVQHLAGSQQVQQAPSTFLSKSG